MKRRTVLTAAAGAILPLAGCSTTGTPDPSTTPHQTTNTITSTSTNSPSTTSTTTTAFEPNVSFSSCQQVIVEAPAYSFVGLVYSDGSSQEFQGNYTGELEFTGTGKHEGKIVEEVLVFAGDQEYSAMNPDFGACVATPTTTTTSTEETTTTTTAQETTTTTTAQEPEPDLEIRTHPYRRNVGTYDEVWGLQVTVQNTRDHP
ncbi:hypothetical protein ACFQH6_20670 [Halobacteriaceae archaeon GCM10025711]